jgi:hypothetical protein
MLRAISLVLVLFSATDFLAAQAVAVAQINGRVADPSGAVVAGATVRAEHLSTNEIHTAKTNTDGDFVFNNLPVGEYTLSVDAGGFKDYRRTGIVLHVGDNISVGVSLSVGQSTETVNVNAAASAVDTTDNSIRQVIDQASITNMPLNGRQPTQLVLLTPGAVTASVPSTDIISSKNFYSSTTISVAGGQPNQLNYVLDGGDNNDPMTNVNLPFPFPEALQEFSVDTSTLPAQYGLHPGGVVNIVTRSGGNQFHGDAFEYIRNYAVNAKNYFASVNDSLKRNQFGGVIGGPVVHNMLYFFSGYQGTRNIQNPSYVGYVPTPAVLQGDFSTFESSTCVASGARTLINPQTGQPYSPKNQIPITAFNSAAIALTKYLPTTSDPCGKVVYTIPNTGNEDQVIGRIDATLGSKQSLYGRYFADDYRNPGVFTNNNLLTTTRAGNLELSQSLTLSDTYTFTPDTLNSLHLTVNRLRNNRGPAANDISPQTIGVNMYDYVPVGLQVGVGSDFSVGCTSCAPAHINRDELHVADDVYLVRGSHSFMLGVDIIHSRLNSRTPSNADGLLQFNGTYTGDAMADFLTGELSTFEQAAPITTNFRDTYYGFYAQDTYKVNSRMTINAGLRWEPYLPATNIHNWGTEYDANAYIRSQTSSVYLNAPPGIFFYGDKGIPKSLMRRYLPSFSPRLGLIIAPNAKGHDTLRIGGAILTDLPELYFANHILSAPPPYADTVNLSGVSLSDPWATYPGGNPFPLPPLSANVAFPQFGSFVSVPPTALTPESVTQWNASYEHQFNDGFLMTISYLGNKTTHMWGSDEENPAQYIPGAWSGAGSCGPLNVSPGTGKPCSSTANTNQRRILNTTNAKADDKFGDVELLSSNGNASYNSLVVAVKRYMKHGYTISANYTYSHCISDLEDLGDPYQPEYEIPFYMAADRGNCDFDVPNIINASIVTRSSGLGAGLMRDFTKDWQFAPLVTYDSGMPVNVVTGVDRSLTGQGLDRPNRVLSDLYAPNRSAARWLNPAAFSENAVGAFGNVARNAARAPGFFEFDGAVSRLIPIHERLTTEFRLDVFNIPNWVNFGAPNGSLTSSNFGKITTANNGTVTDTPRVLQGALKLHF